MAHTRRDALFLLAALAVPLPAHAQRGRGAGRALRRYQEPAAARGYSDGYQHGWNDGYDRDRYDPAGHRDYRAADRGFSRAYGRLEAYRNNYRAGFRPGYDEGYRDGIRSRR